MLSYIAKRLIAAVPVILGLSIIVFLVMKLICHLGRQSAAG